MKKIDILSRLKNAGVIAVVDILSRLKNAGVIAVVRGKSKEEALNACHAIIKGGLTGIELTFTVPQADQVIKELLSFYKDQPEIVIGAGTVLDAVTARLAILAGAEYIVSPSFDQETAEMCNLYQIPYLPGCMTIMQSVSNSLLTRMYDYYRDQNSAEKRGRYRQTISWKRLWTKYHFCLQGADASSQYHANWRCESGQYERVVRCWCRNSRSRWEPFSTRSYRRF